jgi:hypothetical protein
MPMKEKLLIKNNGNNIMKKLHGYHKKFKLYDLYNCLYHVLIY